MKYVSIFSVTLKSAITPSFMGLIATTLPGVRPSMSLASFPTATTSPLFLLMATMDGSFTTMPLPFAYTNVLAVPRSIARSEENRLKTERRLYPFLFMVPSVPDAPCGLRMPRIGARPAGPTAWFSPAALLRNYNFHTLDDCAAPAILSSHGNVMAAAPQRLREVFERAVGVYIRHRLTVDDQRRARLGAPADLHYVTMQFGVADFQHHLLALALCRERKLERIACRADVFLRIRSQYVPEIIARVEPADFR